MLVKFFDGMPPGPLHCDVLADYEKLQDIGKSAFASIAEMVAALECDYDRLEELREMRSDMRGWLVKCDDGTYDARNPATDDMGYDYHNLGDGKTAESALKAFFAAHCPDYAEELAELESAAGECESRDDAEQRIHEDPLSLEVRGDWSTLDESADVRGEPVEFKILLGTGGPAVRIVGELRNGEPYRARLETQDWFKPWTEYRGGDSETLLTYCRCFYFGEERTAGAAI